jgi:hypothetical protein
MNPHNRLYLSAISCNPSGTIVMWSLVPSD